MSEWIDIKERRPDFDMPVLIRAFDGTITAAELSDDCGYLYWDGVGFGGHEWDWDWEHYSVRPTKEIGIRGVTHWMPLPAQP